MSEISRDPLGFNAHPNYMELVRAYARLHYWAIEAIRQHTSLNTLSYECGYTASMMSSALHVTPAVFDDVCSRLFIGDPAGHGGVKRKHGRERSS
jgi:hypothetical protein